MPCGQGFEVANQSSDLSPHLPGIRGRGRPRYTTKARRLIRARDCEWLQSQALQQLRETRIGAERIGKRV